MEKVGIENLKVVADFGMACIEAGVEIGADGKITLQDVKPVLGLIPSVPALIAAVPKMPAEVADVDAEEGAELVAHIMGKLAVDDAKAREVIGISLKIAVKLAEVAPLVVALVKVVKA